MRLAVMLLAVMSLELSAIGQIGCGITPIKPIPPIGCKDLRPQCECDAYGHDCHIVWVCVPIDQGSDPQF